MTRVYQHYQRRTALIALVVILAWVGLGYRLFDIQIIHGKEYFDQGHKQGQAKKILPAIRGNIYDANNVPLTRNTVHYTIAADPAKLNDNRSISEIMSSITGKPAKYYQKKLIQKGNFVYLERNLKKQYVQSIVSEDIEGLIVQRHSRRSYPHDNIGGQLVGFTNVDDQGLAGLEQKFDNYLAGEDGWVIKQVTGLGESSTNNNYPKQDPIDGSDIYLSINVEYQTILLEELEKQLKKSDAASATGLIVNPQSGSIMAIGSVPDFNPNNPGRYPIENQKLRAITDQFEPGSTYKIVTATAAIDKGLVQVNDIFDCENGKFEYNSITISDHEPHGMLSFAEIIEQSSNIGIIKIASLVGQNELYRYSQEYGFGSATNLELSAETVGTLRKPSEWSQISLAEIAMGYEVGISVIQLAMAFSAIANDGILLKPYLINEIRDQNNKIVKSNSSTIVRRIADRSVMNTLTDLLVQAVEKGTGTEAFIPGWQVAGKTGTAQKSINGKYSNTKFESSFVGFLPASDPQLLCVIVLDEPKHGYHWGAIGAAPVFKRVMERIINIDDSIKPPTNGFFNPVESAPILVEKKLEIKKDNIRREPILLSSTAVVPSSNVENQKTVASTEEVNRGVVPNVKGMSLKKAIRIIQRSGYDVRFAGSGRVVWQTPIPGTLHQVGEICSIGLE